MVLKADDPGYLRVLMEEGRDATKRHLEYTSVAISKYAGRYFVSNSEDSEWTPENTYFEYMTAMLPRLVYHNPRWKIRSRRAGAQSDVAEAMQAGLNRIVKDARFHVTLRDVALDMLFAFGVVLVKETQRDGLSLAEDDPIYPSMPTWPVAERVPPDKFFMDPLAYEWKTCRYQGHEWRIDKEDLLQRASDNPEEGWNKNAIEALSVDTVDDQGPYGLMAGQSNIGYIDRKEIRAYDIWFPEIELDDSPGADAGFHGTVYTIAVGQSGEDKDPKTGFIREPRPFYGPRTGPYTLFGVYKVPNSPYPLSPLVAVEGQIRELNTHARVSSQAMRKYKRMIGVSNNTTAQRIKNAPHDHVVAIDAEDLRNAVVSMEFAGLSEHTIAYEERLRERVNRLIGMDETMRGSTTGEGTATEHTLASESATARISEIKAAFTNAVVDVGYSLGHYLFYSDTTVFPVSDQMLQEGVKLPEWLGQDVQLWFRGGNEEHGSGYTYEDLELDIEPFSMERTSEGLQMQRMMQAHEIVRGDMPLWAQYPDFPWKEWYKKLGDAFNLPELEDIIRPEMMERLAMQLEMMTQMQAQPQMAAPQGAKFETQLMGGGKGPRPMQSRGPSQAAQGQGKPTAARTQGGGMPGNKSGGSFGKVG